MSTDALPAITVQQPWAWAIAIGEKTIENRGRNCTHRGPIAIHAGKTWSEAGAYDERVHKLYGCDRRQCFEPLPEQAWRAQMGAVVAVAELVGCHAAARQSPTCCQPWGELHHYGAKGFRCVAHHLVLANVRVLSKPVPCAGKVMVPWTLPADVAAEVQRQVS